MKVEIEVKKYKESSWNDIVLGHDIQISATAFRKGVVFCAIEFGKVTDLEQLKEDAVNRVKQKIEDYITEHERSQMIEKVLGIEFQEIEIEGE